MPSIISDHNGMKLEVNNKRKTGKIRKHSPDKRMGQRKNKESKNTLRQMKMGTQHTKIYGLLQKWFWEEVYSDKYF